MFPGFPNYFLPFPPVFPHVSPGVSTVYFGVSPVSARCFPGFLFKILRSHDTFAYFHIDMLV